MKKFSIFIAIIIVTVSVGGYFYFFKNMNTENLSSDKSEVSTDTLQYKNIERSFTLEYPRDLKYKDTDEGDTTHTIVFSDDTGDKSFQIFFTPYLGDQITQSRILKDVSSGKFTQPIDIVINGSIRAIVFFSTIDVGEMREVWFLHDGYLFQVTTYRDLDEWLAKIMETWEFYQTTSAGGR